MLLSRSFRRKLLATVLGSLGFLLLYQTTVIDSRSTGASPQGPPAAGAKLDFVATAYCKGQTTASGVSVRAGVAAADPDLLPQGSVVELEGVPQSHRGIYTVLDTGPKVQGRHVDLYMWSCYEALAFGRRPVRLTVLRLGWSPKNSLPKVLPAPSVATLRGPTAP
jgi:3D (Asp-Asp-Asp) domain-containing protein